MGYKPEKLSDLAKDVHLEEPRARLQAATLVPIVRLFAWGNGAVILGVFTFAFLEWAWPQPAPIITANVLIALIGGLTLQVGTVIIAAFRGLFAFK